MCRRTSRERAARYALSPSARSPSARSLSARSLSALALLALSTIVGCGPSYIPVRLIESGPPLPELAAAGWLNGGQPSSSELAGSVVVIDCFASW